MNLDCEPTQEIPYEEYCQSFPEALMIPFCAGEEASWLLQDKDNLLDFPVFELIENFGTYQPTTMDPQQLLTPIDLAEEEKKQLMEFISEMEQQAHEEDERTQFSSNPPTPGAESGSDHSSDDSGSEYENEDEQQTASNHEDEEFAREEEARSRRGSRKRSRGRPVTRSPRSKQRPTKRQKKQGSTNHSIIGRCCEESHLVYTYPTMPEQSKPGEPKITWFSFYCKHRHTAKGCLLHLRRDGVDVETISPLLSEAWATRDVVNGGWQHKWCFVAPETTFKREVFESAVSFSSATYGDDVEEEDDCESRDESEYPTMEVAPGPTSFVSTTSQRKKCWTMMKGLCTSEEQKTLIENFKSHPATQRHFRNRKGTGQGIRVPEAEWFRHEEFDKAVPIPTRLSRR